MIPQLYTQDTVNTRYRHIFGSRETCTYNLVVSVTWTSRYRHICHGPWGRCACNEGNSIFCSQGLWTSSAMSLRKNHREILSCLLIGVWVLAMVSYSLCRAVENCLHTHGLSTATTNAHAHATALTITSTRVSNTCDHTCHVSKFYDVIICYRHRIAFFRVPITWCANVV